MSPWNRRHSLVSALMAVLLPAVLACTAPDGGGTDLVMTLADVPLAVADIWTPSCETNEDCPEGAVCFRPVGSCTGPGECMLLPDPCPEETPYPLCGCDGETYADACEAYRAGGGIVSDFDCVDLPGVICPGSGICSEDAFCWREPGNCSGEGVCVPRPNTCILASIDPICGCDGLPYRSPCLAAQVGIGVGPPELCLPEPCSTTADCPGNKVCFHDVGEESGLCDGEGGCYPVPGTCDPDGGVVCGCDGVFYDSECEAWQAGAPPLLDVSPCLPPPCESSAECPEGQVCYRPVGTCDSPGHCLELPGPCPESPYPLCGCDGESYTNACEAYQVGGGINNNGECWVLTGEPCLGSGICSEDAFCWREPGNCSGEGVCVPRPNTCILASIDPICGCDGLPYRSPCLAAQVGIGVGPPELCLPEPCATTDDCPGDEVCVGDFQVETGLCDGEGGCYPVPGTCDPDGVAVCGCDGVVYDSECEAWQAGAPPVAGTSICAPDPCTTPADCEDGQVCYRPVGECDETGVCMELPPDCSESPFPYCGCDGEPYTNACEAYLVGGGIAPDEECDATNPLACTGSGTCLFGWYCLKDEGDCGGVGSCTPKPTSCALSPTELVCGCDGVMYDNTCAAGLAGTSVGPIEPCLPETCVDNGDCEPLEYCSRDFTTCGGSGFCVDRPAICTDLWDPVCGCDEVTYINECQANQAGMNVSWHQECPLVSDCTTNAQCDPGQYCARAPGNCDGDGLCTDRPADCNKLWQLTCGCDGTTYGNPCEAALAGTSVESGGACVIQDPPKHLWSKALGDASTNQKAIAAAVGPGGNLYVAGYFEGALDFGQGPVQSAGMSDAFLVKFAPDGTLLWGQAFGDASYQQANAVATDPDGNVYIAGQFGGSMDLGTGGDKVLQSQGFTDIFVGGFDKDGNPLWSDAFGDGDWQYAQAVAVDSGGNVYLTGSYQGTVNFGGEDLTSSVGDDIFLVKFKGDGTHLWSNGFGNNKANKTGGALAVDKDDHVLLAGTFQGLINFGGNDLDDVDWLDAFVARFTDEGVHVWSLPIGGTDGEEISGIATDGAGNVLLSGNFQVDLMYDGDQKVNSAGGTDLFVASLTPGGDFNWLKPFGDEGDDHAHGIVAGAGNSVLVAGDYTKTLELGGGSLGASMGSSLDVFVARFLSDGTHDWSQAVAATQDQEAFAIAQFAGSSLFLAGYFDGGIPLDPDQPLYGKGGNDVFVVKYAY